ncbi:leukocyte elastase inhibitor-like [Penaeus chinensis]|uniref:leukocyte elastase inhibitor-like n=1 Tax=Penaeus chinensis TaxID=139456 RepID=UPI001FB78F63|nr:leukocyte elastase inhibitor-like [Penaeus chinensis]XP_047489435.1 leukocyte elastase inhibitor-like [Penaeus chinensis]
MKMALVLVVSLATLFVGVSPQCISTNDEMTPFPRPDLGHITPFSVDLFKEVLPSTGNFIFSPYSVWSALVLAYFGSGGNTQAQLEQVLQLTNKEETLALYKSIDQIYGGVQRAVRAGGGANRMRGRRGCRRPGNADQEDENETKRSQEKQRCRGRKMKGLRAAKTEKTKRRQPRRGNGAGAVARGKRMDNASYTISVANRVYVQEGFPLRRCVRRALIKELRTVDFEEGEAAADAINRFVKGTTRGKIPKLVEPADLISSMMVLINAVFFKGLWKVQFDPRTTRHAPFTTASGNRTQVEMMRVESEFNIGMSEELEAQVLEMPYRGEGASMFVLLPRDRSEEALEMMVERLTSATLKSAMRKLSGRNVTVGLPKFKLETSIREELKIGLTSMGIGDLFSPVAADMSTFSPSERLVLNDGIHKAVIEVNEEGSEAAAATALFFGRSARRKPSFVCNRPFLFFILDKATSNVLFMGAFREP